MFLRVDGGPLNWRASRELVRITPRYLNFKKPCEAVHVSSPQGHVPSLSLWCQSRAGQQARDMDLLIAKPSNPVDPLSLPFFHQRAEAADWVEWAGLKPFWMTRRSERDAMRLRANGAEDGAAAARSFQSALCKQQGNIPAATCKTGPRFRTLVPPLRASRFRVFRPSMFSASRPLCPPHPAPTASPTTLRTCLEGTNHEYMGVT